MIKIIDRFYRLNTGVQYNSVADAINSRILKKTALGTLVIGFFCIDATNFFANGYPWVQGIDTLRVVEERERGKRWQI